MTLICAHCSAASPEASKYCGQCGKAFDAAAGTSPPSKASRPLDSPESFENLYHFVRSHLVVVNSMLGLSGMAVSLLDFLSPRLSVLPEVIYGATALLALCLLAVALVPRLDQWLLGRMSRGAQTRTRLWRRGGWQFSVLLLVLISLFGYESVAKASQGGVLASALPGLRALQARLLSIDTHLSEVKVGVAQANRKLDRLQSEIDPNNPADRCADLECAIDGGASAKAVSALFAKGLAVPGNPRMASSLLWEAVAAPNPEQDQIIDLLLQHGADAQAPEEMILMNPRLLTAAGQRNAQALYVKAELSRDPMADPTFGSSGPLLAQWNSVAMCLTDERTRGPTLIEAAALMGDDRLVAHLRAEGIRFPSRPLLCAWTGALGSHGEVRLRFDPKSGEVASMQGGASFPVPMPAMPARPPGFAPAPPFQPPVIPNRRS